MDKNNFYDFYGNHYDWRGMWNISIPIVFNVRVPLSDKVGLRIGAGPYVQETFVLREYAYQTSNMVTNTTENFMKRFNFGVSVKRQWKPDSIGDISSARSIRS